MQFEVIRKSHKKEIIIGISLLIILGVVLIARFTFAKYSLVKSIKIAEGTINYKVPDFKIMAMYKNDGNGDIEIDTMPESGYAINEEKSYCTLDNVNKDNNAKIFTNADGNHVISGLSKYDKCYLYFDNYKKVNTALGEITVKLSTPDFSKASCSSGCEESTVGIYQAKDDDGWSYYYRGDVENNYVKFANKWWRIIRINGDGSIRLIYDGTSARTNGVPSASTQIGTDKFNDITNHVNEVSGFMYTIGVHRGLGAKSTVLSKHLEPWYTSNLDSYNSTIDTNAGFCGDRSVTSGNPVGTEIVSFGFSITETELKCPSNLDLYTSSKSNKGNKALTYPIGLISSLEAQYAGMGKTISENKKYYLYTGQAYWTISPGYSRKNNGDIYNRTVNDIGSAGAVTVWYFDYGIRPVINLRSDTKFIFNNTEEKGTINNPYIVS